MNYENTDGKGEERKGKWKNVFELCSFKRLCLPFWYQYQIYHLLQIQAHTQSLPLTSERTLLKLPGKPVFGSA